MFVERKLEEAARAGAFDRLPGAGLPIDLSENPYVPAEWRLAFKILADHQIVPEFVERRKEIETIRAEVEQLKADRSRDRVGNRRVGAERVRFRRREVERLQEGDGFRHLPIQRFPDRLMVGKSALEGTRHQEQVFARDAHRLLYYTAFGPILVQDRGGGHKLMKPEPPSRPPPEALS